MERKRNKETVMKMRELFWMQIRGEITHDELQRRLKIIDPEQLYFQEIEKKELQEVGT